jgi:hypothetical protein
VLDFQNLSFQLFIVMSEITPEQVISDNAERIYWNLRERNIDENWLIEFLNKLSKEPVEHNIFIDLVGNRLGTISSLTFSNIFKQLCNGDLKYVRLRFGYDISIDNYYKGMELLRDVEIEEMKKERVILELPWRSDLSLAVEEFIKENNKTINELRKIDASIVKQMENYGDKTLQLKNIKDYIHTDAEMIEKCVTSAVAILLNDSVIVKRSHYTYEGSVGDLDGMVVGTFDGEKVVVFCEAKHNMDSDYKKAQQELFSSLVYWEKLCKLNLEDEETDQAEIDDYHELQVEKYKDYKPMFAFGGCKFSETVMEKRFKKN